MRRDISFWWYCNNVVASILAGIALFEVFHDAQYLSLVWIYNRNRVEKDSSIGGFMRFVFRRSGSLIGVYIGLVFAYGSLGIFKERVEVETIKRILTGVVAASGLLHFYYDGFIWKVRERSTRESLGLTGGIASAGSAQFFPSWLSHGLKWVAIFVIPLTALWIGQTRGPVADVEQKSWVIADLPVGAMQRFDYAASLARAHRFDEAVEQYRIGLSFAPNDEAAHDMLGNLFFDQAKFDEAASHFEQAARLLRAMPIFTLITVALSNVSTARMRPKLNTKQRCGWVRNQRGSITTMRCSSGEPVKSIRRSLSSRRR